MYRATVEHRSKKAMTLVELVVAMTLTAIFAGACVVLMIPIERIYTRVTDQSRAQLLVDTIVDSLRAECADSYIDSADDVWIGSTGNAVMESASPSDSSSPNVLVFHKRSGYCETIFSNGSIPEDAYNTLKEDPTLLDETISSRSVFKMFPDTTGDTGVGYVHFGYFESDKDNSGKVYPTKYYDFTNPFSCATYRGFTVDLTFSDITYDTTTTYPSYVICKIDIKKGTEVVYSRNAVLCFASPVQ